MADNTRMLAEVMRRLVSMETKKVSFEMSSGGVVTGEPIDFNFVDGFVELGSVENFNTTDGFFMIPMSEIVAVSKGVWV